MDRAGWITLGLLGGVVLGFALMGPVWGGMHHTGDWDGTGRWAWGWGMGLVMVLVWVAVIAAVVWLARAFAGAPGGQRSAQDVLDERLARGEISVEEHRERSEALKR